MKARFIEGQNDQLALELVADSDDERLLLKVFCQQMAPSNLLSVQGWTYDGQPPKPYGPSKVRAYVVSPRATDMPPRGGYPA